MIISQTKNNKISGVYEIVNTINGHRYIGSAVNIPGRWGVHICLLRKNKHHSSYLQRAWNKYGEICFDFLVIEYCEKSQLIEREQYYIDTLNPSYNVLPNAGSQLGIKHSDDRRAKNSAAHVGMIPWNKGKHTGKIPWNKGITHSDEARLKISEKAKGRSAWNKGKSSWSKGKKLSEEHKRKIGEGNRGKFVSKETREKIGEKSKDRVFSAETRQKMSESRRRYLENKRANG